MTVSSSTNKVSYSGNGTTTTFPYTFKIFNDSDLLVILRDTNGTETTQVLNTDYTVSGAGDDSGGNVEMVTAPATGETLVIVRSLDFLQETDYPPNDPFPAEAHEDALDKLTMMVQQIKEITDRSFTYPISYSGGASQEMPEPQADAVIGWKSDGSGLENKTSIGETLVSEFGAELVSSSNATDALSILGLDEDLATLSLPANTTISSFAQTLLDDTDAAAARTTLGITTSGVVQIAHTSISSVVSGTTTLPLDDTIPQQSEGVEAVTLSITPKSASNILLIIVNFSGVRLPDSGGGVALFQDSTSNSLAAIPVGQSNISPVTLVHKMTAGTTSSTTFKVRFGQNSAGTVYLNVQGSGTNPTSRAFGGVSASTMTIIEYVP